MDEGPTEPVDSDQPRYQLRNRTTAVSSSLSHVLITSHANLPATDECMAEGRSPGEAAEASLVDPPLREMSQLSEPRHELNRNLYTAFTAAGHN